MDRLHSHMNSHLQKKFQVSKKINVSYSNKILEVNVHYIQKWSNNKSKCTQGSKE